MTLQADSRFGPYHILSALGAGGMGEVYRAKDSKLGRDVALKILPASFTNDPERVARFRREAQVLASLNHPHIAQIYGLEEASGMQFLVLELVDGESLDKRIARGRIPVDEALGIAKQIAEALEAAHEKGIIHRDLKPANIALTKDGHVKVLDFGLAKAVEATGSGSNLSMSPTITTPAMMTGVGVILGTAAYMSPEQAKGRPADKRTDVWAFGCVLCEMLTGQRAFEGEEVSDVLASVLKSEPDFGLLPARLNPDLQKLLRRCLEKNPNRRWHAVGDLRIELESTAAQPTVAPSGAQAIAMPRPLWKRAAPFVVTAIMAGAIAGAGSWYLRPASPLAVVTRFLFTLPEGQQFSNTGRQLVAISPDGTLFMYVANNRLYLKPMRELNAIAVAGTEIAQGGVINPVFSPDGRSLAYFSVADRTFKRIAVSGGAAVTICQADLPFGMSWGPDDQLVFGQGAKGIMRVSAKGGKPETIVTMKDNEAAHGPQVLPGGDAVLFTLATTGGTDRWEKAKIVVQSLKSNARHVLIDGGTDARYVPTGHLVYELNGTLLAVPFDVRHLQVTGGPVPVVEGVRTARPTLTGTAQFSFSDTGSLVYIPGTGPATVTPNTLAMVDRTGKVKALPLPPGPYDMPRISPNGKQLVFHTNDGKEEIVWVYDLSGKTSPRRLTFGGSNLAPMWSGDGERIVFTSDREGDRGIFWQRADGTGSAERLTKADQGVQHVPNSWAPKADRFSFMSGKANDYGIWTYSLQEKKASVLVHTPSSNQYESSFSPDGKWLAYQSNEGGDFQVYVQPYPVTGAKFQMTRASSPGASGQQHHHPIWSPDGKELLYGTEANQMASVSIQTQSGFAFGNPVPLPVKGFVQLVAGPRHFDITPDGKQFVMVFPPGQAVTSAEPRQSPQIEVVINWFEELKQRVPTK
jgi:serine/threonine-protein kinase